MNGDLFGRVAHAVGPPDGDRGRDAECAECARLHGIVARALAVLRRSAGGTVAACRAILREARHG